MIRQVQQAAELLKRGKVGSIPTETSYGLAASIRQEEALLRIFGMKRRLKDKPLLVLISHISMLEQLTETPLPKHLLEIAKRFWPGPVTLLMPALPHLPYPLTGHTGKIGVRISSNTTATRLVEILGHPVTATSANLSGKPPCFSPEEVMRQLEEDPPDFILDGGVLPPGPPSTILDCTVYPPLPVRTGAISREQLIKAGIPVAHGRGPA